MMKFLLKGIIRIYQMFVSPVLTALGARCRFHPTCSEYALVALQEKPCYEAVLLIVKRVLKCGPWHCGGVDFVPGTR